METQVTATELRDIIVSSEFRKDLKVLSSDLASIMQERPIVFLLAKHLRERGHKCDLEVNRKDLSINDKHVEFKFNYDKVAGTINRELKKWPDLKQMWQLVEEGMINSKSWPVLPKIYKDVCHKKPHLFVWIICSRNLSKLNDEELKHICFGRETATFNKKHPFNSDDEIHTAVDRFLNKLKEERPFSDFREAAIETQGDNFTSTYHFRILEYAS